MQISISRSIIPTISAYECTGTATACHMHRCSFLLRFPLSNVDYQDIPVSLTHLIQVIMTGKAREDDKGNSPRKRKPGDSPLTRGMCVQSSSSIQLSATGRTWITRICSMCSEPPTSLLLPGQFTVDSGGPNNPT